jgi:hypothetical protein
MIKNFPFSSSSTITKTSSSSTNTNTNTNTNNYNNYGLWILYHLLAFPFGYTCTINLHMIYKDLSTHSSY